MTKMRKYTFIDSSLPEGEDTKVIEALGYKKAVKSYQISSKAPEVNVLPALNLKPKTMILVGDHNQMTIGINIFAQIKNYSYLENCM